MTLKLSLVRVSLAAAVIAFAGGAALVAGQDAPPSSAEVSTTASMTLTAVADATLYADSPGSPGGSGSFLTAAYYHYDGQVSFARIFLVKFDLAALPPGAIIESAVMQLYHNSCTQPGTYPVPLGAYFVTSPWSEGSVTYATRPTWADIGINAQVGCTPGVYSGWAVTSFAQAWQGDPAHNYGVKVSGPWSDPWDYYISFNSREIYNPPQLVVTYRLPITPTPTPTRRPGTRTYLPLVMKQFAPGSAPVVLFSDNFNDGLLHGWTRNNGNWYNAGNYMRGEYATGNAWNIKDVSGNNFTYEGDLNIVSGNAVGLVFRSSADGTASYDAILDAADGVFKISKRPGYTVLASYPMTVSRNHWYSVKVVVSGTKMEGYLDGVKRLTAYDGNFSSGQFGVMLFQGAGAYDNLEARALP